MGTLGSMVIGATPIGAAGNAEIQERVLLWNVICCELRVTGGRYPLQTKLLGRFLRLMSGKPLPKELQAYLADLVENKLKPRRGRRKSPDISCRNAMIRNLYPLRLREHQDSQLDKVSGNHPSCGNVTTFEDPPHISAAKHLVEETHRQGYPMIDWREVLNIVSSGEMF